MASLRDLPATAAEILALFKAQLIEQGVKVPGRQYVGPGSEMVWDGEQLTVNLMGIAQGMPAQGTPQSFVPQAVHYFASFSVNLVREVTTINTEGSTAGVEVPTPAQLTVDSTKLLADASALILAAQAIHQQYLMTSPQEGFAVEGLQPIMNEGGLGANRMLLSLTVD